MDKKNTKKRIREAFIAETPDMREKIQLACEGETQEIPTEYNRERSVRQKVSFFNSTLFKRVIACAASVALFAVGMTFGYFIPNTQPTKTEVATSVYLDVNPSVQFDLDSENRVIDCIGGNEDGKALLENMDLTKTKMDTALNAIIGAMYVNGNLTSDKNSILVSVDTNSENNKILTEITNEINQVFANVDMECAIIAQSISVNKDLKARAKEQGVSVGKMYLIEKMVNNREDFTEEDISELSGMPIKELSFMYSSSQKPSEKQDEIFSGQINGYQSETIILEIIKASLGDWEDYEIKVMPWRDEQNERIMVYDVRVYLGIFVYSYKINCETGEMVEISNPSLEETRGEHEHKEPVGGEHEQTHDI